MIELLESVYLKVKVKCFNIIGVQVSSIKVSKLVSRYCINTCMLFLAFVILCMQEQNCTILNCRYNIKFLNTYACMFLNNLASCPPY